MRIAAALAALAVGVGGGIGLATLPTGSPTIVRTADAVDAPGLYNSAQKKFAARDIPGGLADIKSMLAVTANDPDALALQAVWADQESDAATRDAALTKLSSVRASVATQIRGLIDGVTAAAAIVPSTSPVVTPTNAAIVILGYGLRPNGSMAPELVKRLEAGLAQAQASPTAPVFVTGGVPKKGITEAAAMKKWLVGKGLSESRVTTEDKSDSTVSNAQNTTELLRARGISEVVLITSPDHVRRGAANFAGAGTKVAAAVTTSTNLSRFLKPLTGTSVAGIRYEATRSAKIPVTKTAADMLPDTGPGLIGDLAGRFFQELVKGGSSK